MAERAESGAGRAPQPGVGRLEAMPLRRKLDILLGVPLAAVLLLLVPVTWAKFDAANQWQDAATAMRTAQQVNVLVSDLETEQIVALGLQGLAGIPNGGKLVTVQQLRAAGATTDRRIAEIRSTLRPATSSALNQALDDVVWETQGANGARAIAEAPAAINSYTVANGYGAAIQELFNALGLDQLSGAGGPAAFDEAELDFLYTADLNEHEREADMLSLANNADIDGQNNSASLDSTDLANFEREYGIATSESSRFAAVASGLNEDRFQAAANSPDQNFITAEQKSIEEAMAGTSPAVSVDQVLLTDQSIPAGEAGGGDLGLVQAAVNASNQRTAMEQVVSGDLIGTAQHQADVSRTSAYGLAAGALLLLLLLLVFEVRVRRSVVLPMRRLTRAARQIAEVTRADLERVADEDEGSDSQAVPSFETVPITTRDEVGDLGEAFNRVQDTAVRVLERQMAVRRNTGEMFGNVGRRIHNLTGRQLSLIDAAEREETDPSVLERLYRIDHLAVRLQRGADSLMLLSGEPEPVFGDAPLRLTDVVRSAVGRVEGYQRVVLAAEGDVTVSPAAVGDLTLIVAELVENAVSFSPATSSVDVSVRPTGTGASVEIVDHGVGMTAARLAEENARLVRRERLDLAPTKVLGLFVVGRLARRSNIVVRLAATKGGGVTVRLDIGTDLLFDAPQPPARRRGPAQAARAVPPGGPTPNVPEQRATRARTGPTHASPAPTRGPDDLPMRRRAAPAPAEPENGAQPASETRSEPAVPAAPETPVPPAQSAPTTAPTQSATSTEPTPSAEPAQSAPTAPAPADQRPQGTEASDTVELAKYVEPQPAESAESSDPALSDPALSDPARTNGHSVARTNGHALPKAPDAADPVRLNGHGRAAPQVSEPAPFDLEPAEPPPDIPSPDLARRIRAAVDGVDQAAQAPSAPADPAALPLLPHRRSPAGEAEAVDAPDQAAQAEGPPPALPRRSRTRAAVREPVPSATAGLAAAHLLDAEAARAAVEEFEAGVEEALRVSAQNLPTLRASDEPEGIRP